MSSTPLRGYLDSMNKRVTPPIMHYDATTAESPEPAQGNRELGRTQQRYSAADELSIGVKGIKSQKITVAVRIRPFMASEFPPSAGANVSYLNFCASSPLTISEGKVKGTRQINITASQSTPANSTNTSRSATPTSSSAPSPITTPRAAAGRGATAPAQGPRSFAFDHVLNDESNEDEVYQTLVASAVDSVLCEGYNATIFAYGQTGSGKTHTMRSLYRRVGEQLMRAAEGNSRLHFSDSSQQRSRASLYESSLRAASGGEVEVSVMELYNEELKDLTASGRQLKLREEPDGTFMVQGLARHIVHTAAQLNAIIESATANRTTSRTAMNDTSSRSHCLVTLSVPHRNCAKVHLVDLAGSERLKKINPTTGFALNPHQSASAAQTLEKDSISINSGLFALGNVINALVLQQQQIATQHQQASAGTALTPKSAHTNSNPLLSSFNPARYGGGTAGTSSNPVRVPFRDSILTKLLKDGLSGNSRTVMIACVSPTSASLAETLNTLTYAQRAKLIRTRPVSAVDKEAQLIAAALLAGGPSATGASSLGIPSSSSLADQRTAALDERRERLRRSVLMDSALAGLIPPRGSRADPMLEVEAEGCTEDAEKQHRFLSTIVNDPRAMEMVASNPKMASMVLNAFAARMMNEKRQSGSVSHSTEPLLSAADPSSPGPSDDRAQRGSVAAASPRARQPGRAASTALRSEPPSVSICADASTISPSVARTDDAAVLLAIERKHSHRLERDLLDREMDINRLMKQISVLRDTEEGDQAEDVAKRASEMGHRPTVSPSPGLDGATQLTVESTMIKGSPPNRPTTIISPRISNNEGSSPSPKGATARETAPSSSAINVSLLGSAKVLIDAHASHLLNTVVKGRVTAANDFGDQPPRGNTFSDAEVLALEVRLLQEEVEGKRADLAGLREAEEKHRSTIDVLKAEAAKWRLAISNSPSELKVSVERIANAPFEETKRKELCEQVRRSCEMKLKAAEITLSGVENKIASLETQRRRQSGLEAFTVAVSSPTRASNRGAASSAEEILSITIEALEAKLAAKKKELRRSTMAAKRPHVSASPDLAVGGSQGRAESDSAASPTVRGPPPAQSPQWRKEEREEIAAFNKNLPEGETPIRCLSVQVPESLKSPGTLDRHSQLSVVHDDASPSMLQRTVGGAGGLEYSISKKQLFDTISSLGRASRDLAKRILLSVEKQQLEKERGGQADNEGVYHSPSPSVERAILLSPVKPQLPPRVSASPATRDASPSVEGKRFQSVKDGEDDSSSQRERNKSLDTQEGAAGLLCQQINETITLLHATDTELRDAESRLSAVFRPTGSAYTNALMLAAGPTRGTMYPQPSTIITPYQASLAHLTAAEDDQAALRDAVEEAEAEMATEIRRLGYGGARYSADSDQARYTIYDSRGIGGADDDDDNPYTSTRLAPVRGHDGYQQGTPSSDSIIAANPHLWPLQRQLGSLKAELEVASKRVAEAEIKCVLMEAQSTAGGGNDSRGQPARAIGCSLLADTAAIEALQDTVRNLSDEKAAHVARLRGLNEALMALRADLRNTELSFSQ